MNCEEAKHDFVEYWRGALDKYDRESLENHLADCPQCRADAEGLKQLWARLGELPEADPGLGMRTRFYAALRDAERHEIERHQKFWWMRHPAFQISFALLILVTGVFIGNVTARNPEQVAQLRNEVNSMKQMVTLSLLQQQNATDRLRGVTWSYRVEESDTEVLSALLATINHDPSINVRLAAIDAMKKYTSSPIGRKGLAQALDSQSSPLVQIALLDQFVDMHENSAVPEIDKLMASPGLNPEVKEHAAWARRQLQ